MVERWRADIQSEHDPAAKNIVHMMPSEHELPVSLREDCVQHREDIF